MTDLPSGATWRDLATPTIPAPGSVHLWRVFLARPVVDADWEALSEEERERAGRLLSPEDRRRFVVSHASLRRILGAALGRAPGALSLRRGEGGKPRLAEGELAFSLARAYDQALIALASQEPVGVDIALAAAVSSGARRTERIFSDRELRFLAAQGEAASWIPTLWTAKEAVVKALGRRLAVPPSQIEVAPAPEGWTIVPLRPTDGYVGAVAVGTAGAQVLCSTWASPLVRVAEPQPQPTR